MLRFLTTRTVSVIILAMLLPASLAQANVLWSDGFEAADGHNSSGSIVPNNGWWTNTQQAPSIHSGLNGMAANMQSGQLTGGSGDADIRNPAGIGDGLIPDLTYELSWKWQIGDSGGFGLYGARAMIGVVDGGNKFNIADPDDNDVRVDVPSGVDIFDMSILLDESNTKFLINGNVVHTSATAGRAGNAFEKAVGVRGFFDKHGNGGWMDDITLTAIPEPASLGLIGIGALVLMARRRA